MASKPKWVETKDDEELLGKAAAFPGVEYVINLSRDAVKAFVVEKDKQSAGDCVTFGPNLEPNVQKMVDLYSHVGSSLKLTTEIQCMKTITDDIRAVRSKTFVTDDEKTSPGTMPFVIFEGSSMMGKTQSFWALQHVCDFPCFYVPLPASQQTLHSAFTTYNVVLQKCLEKDRQKLISPQRSDVANPYYEVPFLRSNADIKFHTLGFLRFLLKRLKATKTDSTDWLRTQANLKFDYTFQACTWQELAEEGVFMVGLDEVQTLSTADLQLLRNLVRLAGGIVVTMGTSSSIVNIISKSDKISRSTPLVELPWSYLVVKFPSILPATLHIRCPGLELDEEAQKFLEHVMEDHGIYGNRPGFVVSVAQALSKTTGSFSKRLRTIIGQVRAELYAGKSHSRDAFLRNQRRLLCAKYAEVEHDEKVDIELKPSKKARKNGRFQPSESLSYDPSEQTLIIDHYAHLSRREGYIATIGGWVLYNTNQQLHYEKDMERKPFKPNIVFPVANDECLLHLVFAYRPFEVPKCETPSTRQVFRLADVGAQDNSNSQQQSDDGMSLEACFCASAVCASHLRDGADQLSLLDFLPQLASELIVEKTKVTLSEDAKSILKPFNRSIPRFSAPNMPLCAYYDEYLSCGTIYRTRNEDCIDCKAIGDEHEDPIFSGEMKSWKADVNIKKLLARVPNNSTIHFVTCNHAPASTGQFREQTMLRSVSVKGGVLHLHRFQEDPETASCLVLFMVLSEMGLK